MQREAVVSSNIASVGYDPEHKVVEVEYAGGRVYHYLEVEPEAWESRLELYDSIGKWVAGNLKRSYECVGGEFEPEPEEDEPEVMGGSRDHLVVVDEIQGFNG